MFGILTHKTKARRLAMAKKGSVGEYICGHCGATSMTVDRYVNKGYGTTRIILTCNKCKQEDYYDSTEGGN
jgi:hypothetical protein